MLVQANGPAEVVDKPAASFLQSLMALWLALGLTVSLQAFGVPPFSALAMAAPVWLVWAMMSIPFSVFMTNVAFLCVDLFFRDVNARNTYKVPAKAPIIFVCAPHGNQLLDPIVVMRTCPRRAGFLCAAKTLRKRIIGHIGRALDTIPVERPQDLQRAGTGVVVVGGAEVRGSGTRFSADFAPGDRIVVNGVEYPVLEVRDDATLVIKPGGAPAALENATPQPYKVRPSRVGRTRRPHPTGDRLCLHAFTGAASRRLVPAVRRRLPGARTRRVPAAYPPRARRMAATCPPRARRVPAAYPRARRVRSSRPQRLAASECIGIFPEGGSHDRTDLLPLKVGASVMALGASARCPGLPLVVVPVGLHYFKAHRFRGAVLVDYGDPISVLCRHGAVTLPLYCRRLRRSDLGALPWPLRATVPRDCHATATATWPQVPPELVREYEKGGDCMHAACDKFRHTIQQGLASVTITATHYDEVQLFWTVRRLDPQRAMETRHR